MSGAWSSPWLNNATGQQLIRNLINSNFPTESVEGHEISVKLKESNYQNTLSITANAKDGEWVEVTISNLSDTTQKAQTFKPNLDGGYAKINFEITKAGLYKIEVQKYSGLNQKVGKALVEYKTFSYSAEYNSFEDPAQGIALMDKLAELGGGKTVISAEDVFENNQLYIHKVINPKPTFAIISLVLFLLDIAVRKFKFKWPHEIVRDKKLKKQLKQK